MAVHVCGVRGAVNQARRLYGWRPTRSLNRLAADVVAWARCNPDAYRTPIDRVMRAVASDGCDAVLVAV